MKEQVDMEAYKADMLAAEQEHRSDIHGLVDVAPEDFKDAADQIQRQARLRYQRVFDKHFRKQPALTASELSDWSGIS